LSWTINYRRAAHCLRRVLSRLCSTIASHVLHVYVLQAPMGCHCRRALSHLDEQHTTPCMRSSSYGLMQPHQIISACNEKGTGGSTVLLRMVQIWDLKCYAADPFPCIGAAQCIQKLNNCRYCRSGNPPVGIDSLLALVGAGV